MIFNLYENWPDFSQITEAIKQLKQNINDAIRPIEEAMAGFKERYVEVAKKITKAARPLVAINKLGKAQFVYWEFLTDEFVDEIIASKNINKTLREICVRDKFRKVNNIIDLCSNHAIIALHGRIFSQTVAAYKNKQYDLAAVGIISVIDGVLSDISGDTATSIFRRANAILIKVEETDSLENEEVAVLALTWTFRETMELISAKSDFNGKEPKNLNRHWIMHGHSLRRRTQLDCIKLYNFLYGILLIYDMVNSANSI